MTTEEAKKLFDYKDGFLYWKKSGSGRKLNQPVGCMGRLGYWQCKANNKQWKVHRLIWLWHGNMLLDNMQIDHIDRNPSNNKIENLRLVTPAENRQNNGNLYGLKRKIVGNGGKHMLQGLGIILRRLLDVIKQKKKQKKLLLSILKKNNKA